mgnify:CR=1 FL=1
MKRYPMLLVLTGLSSLVGCSAAVVDEGEPLGSSSSAVIGVDTYLYLRCNTTGWEPTN